MDRLACSLLSSAALLQELRRQDVRLVIVTAPELGQAPGNNFMFNILASFAEFERDMIALRIAESRTRLRARGQRRGKCRPNSPKKAIVRDGGRKCGLGGARRKRSAAIYGHRGRCWPLFVIPFTWGCFRRAQAPAWDATSRSSPGSCSRLLVCNWFRESHAMPAESRMEMFGR